MLLESTDKTLKIIFSWVLSSRYVYEMKYDFIDTFRRRERETDPKHLPIIYRTRRDEDDFSRVKTTVQTRPFRTVFGVSFRSGFFPSSPAGYCMCIYYTRFLNNSRSPYSRRRTRRCVSAENRLPA